MHPSTAPPARQRGPPRLALEAAAFVRFPPLSKRRQAHGRDPDRKTSLRAALPDRHGRLVAHLLCPAEGLERRAARLAGWQQPEDGPGEEGRVRTPQRPAGGL